jgi:hypothetical protein
VVDVDGVTLGPILFAMIVSFTGAPRWEPELLPRPDVAADSESTEVDSESTAVHPEPTGVHSESTALDSGSTGVDCESTEVESGSTATTSPGVGSSSDPRPPAPCRSAWPLP